MVAKGQRQDPLETETDADTYAFHTPFQAINSIPRFLAPPSFVSVYVPHLLSLSISCAQCTVHIAHSPCTTQVDPLWPGNDFSLNVYGQGFGAIVEEGVIVYSKSSYLLR